MSDRTPSAIVTVGSELTEGLRLDTNTREIALALSSAGHSVAEAVSVGDDIALLADTLRRLAARYELVIVTGGLGPTHDDITREAASRALGLALLPDAGIASRLEEIALRHARTHTAQQVGLQASILEGAEVIQPVSGTAPGQIVATPAGRLALLPGPPHEMRPMLERVLGVGLRAARPRILSCVGMSEPDAQVAAQVAIGDAPVSLTVLATPGLVDVVLIDQGAGQTALDDVTSRVRSALGDSCFAEDGRSLAQVVLDLARERGRTLAVAESCTGGMISTAITDVPGASEVFLGGVVAYAYDVKVRLLGVPAELLEAHGAVSEETAAAMAENVAARTGADLAVSVTGIAGPEGGTAVKPVGTVCFGTADAAGVRAVRRDLFGDRTGIRIRATVTALDLMRQALLER